MNILLRAFGVQLGSRVEGLRFRILSFRPNKCGEGLGASLQRSLLRGSWDQVATYSWV